MLLALNKATFEALAQNSLALGYLLSRSAVEYLTLGERKAIVDRISAALRDQRVADFMRADPGRGSRDGFGGLCAENVSAGGRLPAAGHRWGATVQRLATPGVRL
jgi:hypothetical protein